MCIVDMKVYHFRTLVFLRPGIWDLEWNMFVYAYETNTSIKLFYSPTSTFFGIDGKARLPPFLKFLKGRKKNAFGKFESPHPDETTGEFTTAIFVVPFDQPPPNTSGGDLIYMKYCLDEKKMHAISRQKANEAKMKMTMKHNQQSKRMLQNNHQRQPTSSSSQTQSSSSLSSGLLGNLLGAQKRTNEHLHSVPRRREKSGESSLSSGGGGGGNGGSVNSMQVINTFRDKMERQLNEFNTSSKTEIKISISLAELTKMVDSMEEKSKITMDVMKYIVYEQVEEINEEWVAAKEPGEFMDEALIAVYKTGYAPAEVLEDLNKGELPDEVKQQNRAMREAMEKEEKKKLKMIHEQNQKKLGFEGSSALNTAKRDRRSIEEIQKDMEGGEKRSRVG